MQIENWKIGRLKPYERNSRTHPPEQIAQIKASIREFGFINPVLVDAKGTIIAGHGRLQAANELNLKTVPVIKLAELNEAQVTALRIADNSIPQNSGWDVQHLESELAALEEMKFDLAPLGLDQIQLPDLEEAAPAPATSRSKTKSTLFISVKTGDFERAKGVIAAALRKAKIDATGI